MHARTVDMSGYSGSLGTRAEQAPDSIGGQRCVKLVDMGLSLITLHIATVVINVLST